MGEQAESRIGGDRSTVSEVIRRERRVRRTAYAAMLVLAAVIVAPFIYQQIDDRRFKPAPIYSVRGSREDRVIVVEAGQCESGARLGRAVEDGHRVVLFAESLPGANDCAPPRFEVELRRPVGDRLVIDGNGAEGAGTVIELAVPDG